MGNRQQKRKDIVTVKRKSHRHNRRISLATNQDSYEKPSLRCPRCSGYLINASERYYEWYPLYKDKKLCLNCGRIWMLGRNNGHGYKIIQFPVREETY